MGLLWLEPWPNGQGTGLQNRRALAGIEGSNPSGSVAFSVTRTRYTSYTSALGHVKLLLWRLGMALQSLQATQQAINEVQELTSEKGGQQS